MMTDSLTPSIRQSRRPGVGEGVESRFVRKALRNSGFPDVLLFLFPNLTSLHLTPKCLRVSLHYLSTLYVS